MTTTRKSPDDKEEPKQCQTHIVWAIGVFFSSFFVVFLIFTYVLLYFQDIIYVLHDWVGDNNEIEPK